METITVVVEEEYGYRYWLWRFPGSEAELLDAWYTEHAPTNFFNPSIPNPNTPFRGTVTPMPSEELDTWLHWQYPYRIHTHEPDDSYLRMTGVKYPHPSQKKPAERDDQQRPVLYLHLAAFTEDELRQIRREAGQAELKDVSEKP